MPVITPYIPDRPPNPVVGVAEKNPEGAPLREFAQEVNQTKQQVEQLRGAEVQGLGNMIEGGEKAIGNAADSAITRDKNRAYWTQQQQNQIEAAHENQIALGKSTNDVTSFTQAANQKWNDVKNSAAFHDDPKKAEADYNNLIQNGGVDPQTQKPLFADPNDPSRDISLSAIYTDTQDYPSDSKVDTNLLMQKTKDAGAKAFKGLSDAAHTDSANQATTNITAQNNMANNTMQSQILQSNAPDLNGRLDDMFKALKPIMDNTGRQATLFGTVQTNVAQQKAIDSAYKATFIGAINNPPADTQQQLGWYKDLKTMVTTGRLPQPTPLPGAMNARPDYPAFHLTDDEMSKLTNTIDARVKQAENQIKMQDDVNEGINGNKAFQLQAQVSINRQNPGFLNDANSQATDKVNRLAGEIQQVQNDKSLPLVLQDSRIKSLRSQMAAYVTVQDSIGGKQTHIESEANAQARADKANATVLHGQVVHDATQQLDDHLSTFDELTNDPQNRGANMPAIQAEAVKFLKEVTALRDQKSISETQFQHYTDKAMKLVKASSTWVKNKPQWWNVANGKDSKNWPGIGQPQAQEQTGAKAKAAQDNSWNAILSELNSWHGDVHQKNANKVIHGISPDQQDKITQRESDWTRLTGKPPNAMQKTYIRNKVLSQTSSAPVVGRVAKNSTPGTTRGMVPPPPPVMPMSGSLYEDPSVTQLKEHSKQTDAKLDKILEMLKNKNPEPIASQ